MSNKETDHTEMKLTDQTKMKLSYTNTNTEKHLLI